MINVMRSLAVLAASLALTGAGLAQGVYPAPVLDTIGPSVAALIENYQTAQLDAGPAVQVARN